MKHYRVEREVPAILVHGGGESDIKVGAVLEVRRGYFRNGEGWAELSDGRHLPDVFLSSEPVKRRLSFESAKAQFVHRFTMEHVPAWARQRPCDQGGTETRYYAPQYRSDREWYENTAFAGEPDHIGTRNECYTRNQTWPLGQWLEQPFSKGN